jgi:acetylornithine deacetylase
MKYNLVFAATAEEEISGVNGIESLFASEHFKNSFEQPGSFGIVGEPTQLQLCIAEKGLMVLDCVVTGKAGHAAREEGENAIYKAIDIISWFKYHTFEKMSPLLGEVKMTVTAIRTENTAHNVVPGECSFVVDVRLTEMYTHDEVLDIIASHVDCRVTPRSKRLKASSIDPSHPVVQAGLQLGKKTFGSPTLSDQALIPLPCLKCGPGSSVQSHSADEFILVQDVYDGVEMYVNLISLINT